MKRALISSLFFCALMPLAAQQDISPEAPVAKVGAQTITAGEFLSRYELTPGFQRHTKGKTDEKKAEFLFTLIAEKLLAQQAREDGLDRDTALLNAVQGVERLFVRDELYRREVREKVTISERDMQEAMARAQQDLKIYFLYTASKPTADSLFRLIQQGKALESFRSAREMRRAWEGPDSAVTRWGDADERMESAVYALKMGETAVPVRLDDGYYIPKLMAKSITFLGGEQGRKSLRERVEQILRKRRELVRMEDFITEALKTARADIKAKPTKTIVTALYDEYIATVPARVRQSDTSAFTLTHAMVQAVLQKNRQAAEQPYVLFQHGSWTLETALEKMRIAGLTVERPTLGKIRGGFEQRLHDLIDQEHLTQLGYERQLQHTAAVKKELGPWRDWYLAQLYKNTIGDTLSATEQEIENEQWRMKQDTLAVRDTATARDAVIAMKLRFIADRKLGRLADKFGITVYEKNLAGVTVTNIPAMVYRYIGFGGRMFAVPLTEPCIQWVNFWERKNLRLP